MSARTHHPVQRRLALLGVAAILFQAILFGWHYHELALPSRGAQPALHAAGTAPPAPSSAADDCDICIALHHFSAAPVALVALPLPTLTAFAAPRPAEILGDPAARRAFQARAPPRA